MAEAKYFNNTIIGQYVLTKVPVKVYADGRFLTITDVDDVEDPTMGFGMDENGAMRHFDYTAVEFLSVQGNKVDIETYNKGMADAFGGGGEEKKEEPKEDDKESDKLPKESIDMNLKNILKEISQEEVDAEIEGAEAQIDAAKAKFKAAQAAMKDTIKKSKDKIKAAKANLKVAEEGVVKEDRDYSGMSHGILAVAAKADGEGMAQIAGMLGVDVGEYDLDDDGDLDDLYDDIETALGKVSTAEVEQLYNELRKLNLVEGVVKETHSSRYLEPSEYTFGVGDIVKNKNTACPHHGSMGIVKKMMDIPMKGMVAIYTVTNSGPTYRPGDVLTKTIDQLVPIQKPDGLEELDVRDVHGDKKIENPKTGKKIKFSSALKAPKGTKVYNKARKMYNRLKEK